MIRAKSIGLATGLLMAGLTGIMGGCGDSATTPTGDSGTDVPATGGRTYDYAITQLTIDSNTSATMPHTGFNVDGRFSAAPLQPADCDHRDFFSSTDPDQNEMGCAGGTANCKGGVDNQLPELASAAMMLIDIRQALTTSVSNGSVALLVRLENVNDLQNDTSVDVTIYQGRPMFASCSSIGTPNQNYAIDSASFSSGTTPRFRFPGSSIVGGRLRLAAAAGAMGNVFQLPLPEIMGNSLTLNLYNTAIRVSVTEGAGTNGNLGGYVLRSDLLTALTNIPAAAMYRTVIEGLIAGLVDVQTGTPAACDAPNGGIGVGLGFVLTNATIQAAPVTGAQAGMCGAM